MATIISPSLLAANFLNLNDDINMINQSEADWLHLDIMDGIFVPNISFGFPVIEALAQKLRKPMDVHFMTIHPEKYIERVAKLGAMMMNIHVEACGENTKSILSDIHGAGMKAAITVSPDTAISSVRDYLADVEMVLVMGVHPGFGGQKFIEATIERVSELRKMIDAGHHNVLIEVDGGVDDNTAPRLVAAGCNVLVSGSYIFNASDPYRIISELKSL